MSETPSDSERPHDAVMKKVATTILMIPFALALGLPYGWIADKVFREREPWFTLSIICGLGMSVCAITWLAGATRTTAIWVFVGTGLLYIALRLLFGKGSALEMFGATHLCAILLLLLLPGFARARDRARQLREMRRPDTAHALDGGFRSVSDFTGTADWPVAGWYPIFIIRQQALVV